MSWKDNLIKIEPYVAGEQPDKTDFIKLNANENPYPPAPGVIRAIEQFRGGSLKKYPDANAKPLADAIAARFGLERGNVFLGNGSDDVLALCFRAFFNSDKPVIYPDITYSFYPVWCDMLRIPYETIPVDDTFNITPRITDVPTAAWLSRIRMHPQVSAGGWISCARYWTRTRTASSFPTRRMWISAAPPRYRC